MKQLKWVLVGFFLLEVAGFIVVGDLLGVLTTLLLLVLTSMLGFAVIRDQGVAAAYQSVQTMRGGRPLNPESMPNPIKMIAGLLLILPGFVTDSIGLLLLFPPLRRLIEKRLVRSGVIFDARVMGAAANESVVESETIGQGDTIEGEFERK